jgi:hypothetical protein
LKQQMPFGPDLQVNINIVRKCQQKDTIYRQFNKKYSICKKKNQILL